MGYLPSNVAKMGGDYVMSLLKDESTMVYSRFYDATDATREKLCQGVGMSEDDADYYGIEGVIDVAVGYLCDLGIWTYPRLVGAGFGLCGLLEL